MNQSYAKMLQRYGEEQGVAIEIVLYEDLQLGVYEEGLWIRYKGQAVEHLDFAINRSRESMLSKQLELMGIRVFNTYEVTHLANHKGRSHQFISHLGIPSLKTSFFYPQFMTIEHVPFGYPFVIKSPDGHGGTEVFLVYTREELRELLESHPKEEWIMQELCDHVGEDVRVFVIGGQIIGAIRRFSDVDFRANYCLGGNIEWYALKEKEEALVYRILEHLSCDYVGIDFIVNAKGEWVFNELEDAVGSRSLYTLKKVDTAAVYIKHIVQTLSAITKNV